MTRALDADLFDAAMQACGLDLAALAVRARLDEEDVDRLRRGEDPGAYLRGRIARSLGVTPEMLWRPSAAAKGGGKFATRRGARGKRIRVTM